MLYRLENIKVGKTFNRQYIFLLVIFIGLFNNSCIKENYQEIEGESLIRTTTLAENTVIIDTIKFSEPIIEGQNYIFSFTGDPPDINNGDVVIIQKSGGYIKKVSNVIIEANELRFSGAKAGMTEVLTQYNLNDDINLSLNTSESGSLKFNRLVYLQDGVNLDNGEILIDSLNLFSGFIENELIQVMVKNCTILSNTVIDRRLDIRTVSPKVPGINKFGISSIGELNITTDYFLNTGGEVSYADTMKLIEIEFSRYSIGPIPLIIRLEFYMGFFLETDKNIRIQSGYSSNAVTKLGAQFVNAKWTKIWEAENETDIDSVIWSRNVNTNFQLFIEPRISFIVANESGPAISLKSYYDFSSVINRPDWTQTINSGLKGNLDFFMDVFGNGPEDFSDDNSKLEIQLKDINGDVPNFPPHASFKVTPKTGFQSTPFIFDPTYSTDDEDHTDSLKIRWDWDNDGHYDTSYELLSEVVHNFFRIGSYSVKLEVMDSKGMLDDTISVVNVESSPDGLIASFTVEPEEGSLSSLFVFDASESRDFEGSQGKIKVRWDWENDGIFDTSYSETKAAVHTFSSIGDFYVKLEIQNLDGFLDDTVKMVRVFRDNLPPNAIFTVSPDGGFGYLTTVFEFDATLTTDPDDAAEDLLFRWDFNNDTIWDTSFSNERIASFSYDEIGIYTVRLEVIDDFEASAIASRQIAVSPGNSSPDASFSVNPESGDTNTIFQFNAATSSDREDDFAILEIRWDWENDSEWDTEFSTNKVIEHQYFTAGEYIVSMQIKDSGGLTDIATDTINVISLNTPPVALLTVNPETGDTSTVFTFDASGSYDAEDNDEELLVRLDYNSDGIWDVAYSINKIHPANFPEAKTYSVILEVKDSEGLTGQTTIDVIVN